MIKPSYNFVGDQIIVLLSINFLYML